MSGELTSPTPRTPPWVLPLLLLLGALAASRAATAGWLEEDRGWVREDAAVLAGWDGVRDILADGRPQATSFGRPERPLARLTLAADRGLSGGGAVRPRVHHLANIAWHLAAVVLLFFVLRTQWRRVDVAAYGAGLFALHPLAAPAVTAIAERGQLVAMVFVLAATLCWQRTARDGRVWWGPALLLAFLAPFAHRTALAWPLVLLAWGPPTGAPRPRIAGRPATLLFAIPILVVLLIGLERASPPVGMPEASAAEGIVLSLVGLGRTMLRFVLPVGIGDATYAEAVLSGRFELGAAAWGLVALVGLTALVVLARAVTRRAGPVDALLGGVVLLGLGHALLVPLGADGEARAAYGLLPPLVAAAAFAVAHAMRSAARAGGAARWVTLGSSVLGAVALGVLARDVAGGFQDEPTSLDRRLDRNPDDVLALERLSAFHRREAAQLRRDAAQLPAQAEERGQLNWDARQHVARALSAARQATEHPIGYRRSASWAALGLALMADGKPPAARPWLERATQLDASLKDPAKLKASAGSPAALAQAEVFHALGQAYATTAEPESALEPYVFAAALAPDDIDYLQRAGLALDAAGRFAEGLPLLERAWEKAPRSEKRTLRSLIERERETLRSRVDRLLTDGKDALSRGDYLEARRWFEAALTLEPDNVEALVEGGYLGGWHFGRYEEGLERLERAERLLRDAGLADDDPARTRVVTRREDLAERLAKESE
ncbi:MAG: tetratricopeptide repeat protein [Planctomycetota bacterium]